MSYGSSRKTGLLHKRNSTSSGKHQRRDRQLYLGVTLRYDFPRNVTLQCPTCFEGERVTPTQGEDYATHAPFAPVCLRFCSSRNPAFSADRFSDSIFVSPEHEFNRHKQCQSEYRQGELHQQRYVREQQRANSPETRELFRTTAGSHRTMSRWKLQFQPEPKRDVLTPWRRG